MVDWQILATIAAPILALLIGALINRWFENRPQVALALGTRFLI